MKAERHSQGRLPCCFRPEHHCSSSRVKTNMSSYSLVPSHFRSLYYTTSTVRSSSRMRSAFLSLSSVRQLELTSSPFAPPKTLPETSAESNKVHAVHAPVAQATANSEPDVPLYTACTRHLAITVHETRWRCRICLCERLNVKMS